jgi:membrane protein EpsK
MVDDEVATSSMMDTTTQFKRQLPRNVLLQVLSFATSITVGILLTPYLVRHLGRAAYGLIPIAGVMTQYVSIITHSVSSATGRFLTIALQRNDIQDANRILNTAFFSYVALSTIQIPVFGLIIYYANSIFTIPPELYADAIILLVCSATSFLIGLIAGVFGVPIYANNRLDISRSIDVVAQITRIAGIVVLFVLFGPALRYVGYVSLVIGISTTTVTILIGKRLAPVLKLNIRVYDWSQLRQIMGMGGWLLVNYIGFLFFLKMDVWICNRFISAEAAGEYAAVYQWSGLIRQAGTLLSGVIGPMIIIYYARAEVNRLVRLAQVSVRVFCLLLAIPTSILCVCSSSILRLWLGESFAHLGPLMVIMLWHLTINIGILPLFNIQTTLNRVRVPALVSCGLGVVNLALAISLVRMFGWGLYGVATASAVALTVKNALFTPVYAAIILEQPWHTFIRSSMSGVALMAGLTGFGCLLGGYMRPQSWSMVMALAAVLGGLGLIAVSLILSNTDRRLIIDLIPGRLRPFAKRLLPV